MEVQYKLFYLLFHFVFTSRCLTKSHNSKHLTDTPISCLALFLCQFTRLSTFQFSNTSQTLRAQDTTTPVFTDLIMAVIVVGLDGLQNLSEVRLIVGLHIGQRQSSAGLAAYQQTKTGFALNNAIGNTHFTAKCRKEQNQL